MSILRLIGQYILNWLNLLDHALNCLLLGDADETISARVARARAAGHYWAIVVCLVLTRATTLVTFGKVKRDHCVYALDKRLRPNSREIWSWSTDTIELIPVSEVIVTEDPQEFELKELLDAQAKAEAAQAPKAKIEPLRRAPGDPRRFKPGRW